MGLTVGSTTTLLSTELNSLGNGSWSNGSTSAFDNRTNLYEWADFELVVTFGSNATAGKTVDLYLLPAVDNTNYADGSSTVVPQKALYLGSFEVRAATAHRLALVGIPIPPESFKAQVQNNAGVAFPASGSTLKMTPYKA